MKKSVFALFIVFLVSYANAQSEYKAGWQKGSIIAGGSLGMRFGNGSITEKDEFDTYETKGKINTFLLSPRIGTFVSNGFAMGLSLDLLGLSAKEKDSDSKINATLFTAGPFIRYYTAKGIFFHSDIAFGAISLKETYEGGSDKNKVNLFKWQGGVGYSYFLNDHVCIEPSLVYRKTSAKNNDSEYDISGYLSELSLQVGLSIFLHK